MSDIVAEAADFFNKLAGEREVDVTSALLWTYTFGPLNEYQAEALLGLVARHGLTDVTPEFPDVEGNLAEVQCAEVRMHTADSFTERVRWLDDLARNNRSDLVDWGVERPSPGALVPRRKKKRHWVLAAIRQHFVIHLILLLAIGPILIYFAAFYHRRGFDNRIRGNLDRAIADDTEAIRLNPDARTFNNRGVAYRKKGDLDRAIADYDEAIRLNPQYALAYTNRGYAYWKKRNFNRALADLNTAIGINPQMATAYTCRGDVYMSQREFDSAIADYDIAIGIEPDRYAEPYQRRALAYRAKGDFEKANADFATAKRLPYRP